MLYRLAVVARAAARCWGWSRGAAGWCARCWGSPATETRAYCRARGARVARGPVERRSLASPARACAHDVLEALRTLGPAAERRSPRRPCQLRDEAEVLERGDRGRARRPWAAGRRCRWPTSRAQPAALVAWPASLARRRREPRSLSRAEADAVLALGERGGSAVARPRRRPAGGGRVRHGALQPRRRAAVPEPGGAARCRAAPASATGRWRPAGRARRGLGRELGAAVLVRPWRDGDRMRPVGPRRHQDASGPLHRPEGPPRAAPHAARWWRRRRDRLGGRRGAGRALRAPAARPTRRRLSRASGGRR